MILRKVLPLAGALLLGLPAWTQTPLPGAKPITRMQAVPQAHDQISFQREEKEIARYHFSPDLNRPFIFPLIGPSGRTVTRMGHPGDPYTHSHHNSVWIALGKLNGVDFWSDQGSQERGRIVHHHVQQIDDGDDRATVLSFATWRSNSGKALLNERRETAIRLLPNDEWLLIVNLRLEAASGPVTLDKEQLGPIGVRMAKSISVHFGGGRLRNSEGGEGEAQIFRRKARWVDYSGFVAPGAIDGAALMDHPTNPKHPAYFHVREDGWMGALIAFDAPVVITSGNPLQLRYGVYVHGGIPSRGEIDKQWQFFAEVGKQTRITREPPLRNP